MTFEKKLLNVICFIIGPALLTANIFGFGFREAVGDNSIAVAYVYSSEARTGIAIGVALVAGGLLRKYWAQKS
jgi:hypothetical protein